MLHGGVLGTGNLLQLVAACSVVLRLLLGLIWRKFVASVPTCLVVLKMEVEEWIDYICGVFYFLLSIMKFLDDISVVACVSATCRLLIPFPIFVIFAFHVLRKLFGFWERKILQRNVVIFSLWFVSTATTLYLHVLSLVIL